MGCASEKLELKVGGTNSASPDHSISSYIQYIYIIMLCLSMQCSNCNSRAVSDSRVGR